MKLTHLLACVAAIAASFAAPRANGQNLPATLIDMDPFLNVDGTVDNGSFVQTWTSGVMNFTSDQGAFQAFCIDPVQGISYGESLVYQIQNPLTLVTSENVARLVGGYLASLTIAQDPVQAAQNAAAVHWAIWEVTTENLASYSLADGNVRITSAANQDTINLANQYLANINTFTPASLTYLTSPDRQDVVTWNVIPEPASTGLLALSGLLLLRRRR